MSMLRAHLNVTSSLSSDYCKGIFLQNASASTSISKASRWIYLITKLHGVVTVSEGRNVASSRGTGLRKNDNQTNEKEIQILMKAYVKYSPEDRYNNIGKYDSENDQLPVWWSFKRNFQIWMKALLVFLGRNTR